MAVGKFKDLLEQGWVINGDGALGTQLIARGLKPGEVPELWNIERPSVVEEIHRLYVEAGARMIETNTFGATELMLARKGESKRMAELNRRAVDLARHATTAVSGEHVLVAGAIGPTGELLSSLGGEAKEEDLYRAFESQAQVLAESSVDLLIVETMTSLAEAVLAVEAASKTGVDVLATMTYSKTDRGFYTVMGDELTVCIDELYDAGAIALGSNCGNGTALMLEIAKAQREFRAELPSIFQSNAGMPKVLDGELIYDEEPEDLAAFARSCLDIGVNAVGGCCGTGPEHVRAIAEVFAKRNARA